MRSSPAVVAVLALLLASAISGGASAIGFAAEVKAPLFQSFEGVISRINHKEVVINDVAFPLQSMAHFDFSRLVAGTYVSFRLNADGMVVGLTATDRPPQPTDEKRFFGPATVPETPPPPSANGASPKASSPIKRQNGVWTN
ncbi:MAG: hypothetical protein LBH14_05305 [Desulfobulbaceae bacterium]|nr:hypothetical protein [Desulfobulbaceae bacterium]